MPDNNPNIPIPIGEWVNLYTLTGITVGEPLHIKNLGVSDIRLAVQAAKPDNDHSSYDVIEKNDDIAVTNNSGDSGAWAISPATKGLLSVASTADEGFRPALKALLADGLGNQLSSFFHAITGKYVLNIHNADVHNIPVNDFFHRHTATQTTLTTATASGDIQLDVVDSTGFAIGDLAHLGTTFEYIEPRHPIVTDVPDINTIVLDGPIHTVFPIGTPVIKAIANMASQNGTLAAPVSYKYFPGVNRVEHVTRILIEMTHDSAGADDLFGGITALLNGMHLRANISGQFGTFTNWKTNGDIKLDMFDVNYSIKSGPGDFGTNGRGSFSRIGVVIRLDSVQSDFIELLVQDTIVGLGLSSLRIKVQGHVEGQ